MEKESSQCWLERYEQKCSAQRLSVMLQCSLDLNLRLFPFQSYFLWAVFSLLPPHASRWMHVSEELEAGWRLEWITCKIPCLVQVLRENAALLHWILHIQWHGLQKKQLVFVSDRVPAQNLLPLFLKLNSSTSLLFLSLWGTVLVQLSPLQ